MRKVLVLAVLVFVVSAGVYIGYNHWKASNGIIRDVVIYKKGTTIGSLYDADIPFEAIDRTKPEGVLFAKTKVVNTNQLRKIYSRADVNDKQFFKLILSNEISPKYKEEISQESLLFSFCYYGKYGPPCWFCVFDDQSGNELNLRGFDFFEKEGDKWKIFGDIAKYPVITAVFDLYKKYGILDAKKPLNKSQIKEFIKACSRIDDIIDKGMKEDPEHYARVQKL